MLSNSSLPHNSSLDSSIFDCSYSSVLNGKYLSASCYIIKAVLIIPLAVIILYLAYQRRRKQGNWSTSNHCDIFTYHVTMMELIGALGTVLFQCGRYLELYAMAKVGRSFLAFPYCGEAFFHSLTCMERYLAVVHPHTYRGLKTARGVRFRNVSVGCVWLVALVWMVSVWVQYPDLEDIPTLAIVVLSLIVISFCSVSVLCALIRPGPGEGAHGKERVDQSKQRAFYTVTAILGVLWFWFAGLIVIVVIEISPSLSPYVKCLISRDFPLFSLPCSLVLPLLYLQREGKLPVCYGRG